jgi:condensation domain-containing protein
MTVAQAVTEESHADRRVGTGTSAEPFPLTDLQEAYLVGTSPLIELGGFEPHFYLEFDVVALAAQRTRDVLDRLVARHEHLRTVVVPGRGQRVLDVGELAPLRVAVTDLSRDTPANQRAALAETRDRMVASGRDPTRWPLFEVAVSVLRRHRARIHVGMSLLLVDAHSTWHLLLEALELYQDPARVLPPVPLTFREWRWSLRQEQSQEAYRKHWYYWAQRLDSFPEAPLLPLVGPLANIGPAHPAYLHAECGAVAPAVGNGPPAADHARLGSRARVRRDARRLGDQPSLLPQRAAPGLARSASEVGGRRRPARRNPAAGGGSQPR